MQKKLYKNAAGAAKLSAGAGGQGEQRPPCESPTTSKVLKRTQFLSWLSSLRFKNSRKMSKYFREVQNLKSYFSLKQKMFCEFKSGKYLEYYCLCFLMKLLIFQLNSQIPQLNGSIWFFFMPFFYPWSSKNYQSNGQQAKKSYLVQVKKAEFFVYMGKKSCHLLQLEKTRFFTRIGKKFCFFHLDQI